MWSGREPSACCSPAPPAGHPSPPVQIIQVWSHAISIFFFLTCSWRKSSTKFAYFAGLNSACATCLFDKSNARWQLVLNIGMFCLRKGVMQPYWVVKIQYQGWAAFAKKISLKRNEAKRDPIMFLFFFERLSEKTDSIYHMRFRRKKLLKFASIFLLRFQISHHFSSYFSFRFMWHSLRFKFSLFPFDAKQAKNPLFHFKAERFSLRFFLFRSSTENEWHTCNIFFLKVWWHYATLFEIYYFLTFIHTIQSHIHSSFTIRRGPSSWILIASSLSKGSLHGMPSRDSNSGLPYSKPTHYQLSCAASSTELRRILTELRRILTELRRILHWAAPHHNWAAPHPNWAAPVTF